MKRWLASLATLVMLVSLSHAHFIWVMPDADGNAVRVFFSDDLTPDDPKLLAKIAKTEVFLRDGAGKAQPAKWVRAQDAFRVEVPADKQPSIITAICTYGVIQRGKAEPYLLHFNASAFLKPGYRTPCSSWERLGLEVKHEPNKDNRPVFRVLWQGQPLAGTDVVVRTPGETKEKDMKTNQEGFVDLGTADKPGPYGIRVQHVVKKTGKQDGIVYKEIRFYSTLVFRVGEAAKGAALPAKANSAATKVAAELKPHQQAHPGDPVKGEEHAALFDLVDDCQDPRTMPWRMASGAIPETWDAGTVPGTGARVVIPAGRRVIVEGLHDQALVDWVRVDGSWASIPRRTPV